VLPPPRPARRIEHPPSLGPHAGHKLRLAAVLTGHSGPTAPTASRAPNPTRRILPSWPCEFDSRHPLRREALVASLFLRRLAQRWPVDSEPWALYGPHLLEFTFDPELQRIRDLAIPFARRVLVDQGSTHAAVAHGVHQLAGAGAACRCQVVASVARIVEVESGGKTRQHDGL